MFRITETRRRFLRRTAAIASAYPLASILSGRAAAQAVAVRRNIATLSPTGPEIAALRRGVDVMRRRHVSDPTSWAFQANIHGSFTSFSPPWNQCQHGSFFFLPWHRMYLFFFERILRAASGDPSLAVPYWDYSNLSQRSLPSPFRQPASQNPLFIAERNTAINQGALLPASATSASATFLRTNFTSPPGSALSFGGQFVSGFNHFALPHGELERQPHDVVHDLVGGFMADPRTAASDPIFWLHHANIDRLWKRWLDQGFREDPIRSQVWMNTPFQFFDANGQAVWVAARQFRDTVGQLGYRYDDDPPSTEAVTVAAAPAPATEADTTEQAPVTRDVIAASPPTESGVTLGAQPVTIGLEVDLEAAGEALAATESGGPSALVLNVEGIDFEQSPGVYYEIYLNLPPGVLPHPQSIFYVGNLTFFAQKMPAHHPGGAPTESGAPAGGVHSYDITALVRAQRARNLMTDDRIWVSFVMRGLEFPGGQESMAAPLAEAFVGRVTIANER